MRSPAPPPPSGFLRRRGEAMSAGFVETSRHNVDQILSHIPATAYVPGAPRASAAFGAPLSRIPYAPAATPVAPYVPAAATPVAPYVPAAATQVAPYVPAAAAPHASAAPPLHIPRRNGRNRRRKLRRQYLAELAEQEAAASRDPSLTPAPAPCTQDLHAAATAAAPPLLASAAAPPLLASAASVVDPRSHVPTATHATATRPTPLYRVPAVPSASDASPFPISRIRAVPHTAGTSTVTCSPPTPAAPPASSASPSAAYFSPPRELSKRATGSAFSAPRKFSQRPAPAVEEDGCQIAGAVGPPALTGPMPPPQPSPACPPRPMPPPSSPLSHNLAAPRSSASPAIDHYSPPRELSQPAAASRCRHSPPRELSQRPAPVVNEESNCQIVGAVGPAGADQISSVPPVDARMASEACVKSVPGERHARVGREEESNSVDEIKRELERVSKEMNDLRNEFAELKKGMKHKDLEIEAKEAEIQNLKKAKVDCSSKDICSPRMDIDQSFHTPANEALLAEGSRWTSTRRDEKLNENNELYSSRDGTSTLGGYMEENAHLETKSNKCEDIKAKGVQADIKAALHFRIREKDGCCKLKKSVEGKTLKSRLNKQRFIILKRLM